MFSSFQQSSEVSFQIPSTLHHQQQDHLHNHRLTSSTASSSAALHRPTAPSYDHKLVPSPRKPGRKRSYNNLQQQQDHRVAVDYDDDNKKKKKKMEHREIERKRRQEMANLCSSLRSLLPLDFIKGKRSMSEHMNQAVNYVKHLEEKIKGLKKTRDEIKKTCPRVTDTSSVLQNKNNTESESSSRDRPITVTVECSHGVIEVLVTSCIGFPISRVVKALVQEGLNVISCNSTKVNERLIHSIHSEETLADRWPRLAALETNLNCSVADRCERSSNGSIFHGQWRREIRDGREALEVRELEEVCKNAQMGSGDSKWSWVLCRSGFFNVSSLRKAVDEGTLRGVNHVTSWNKIIPPKVRIFSWKTRLDRLPTLDNLLKRGVCSNNARCVLCNETNESRQHLFIECRKSAEVRLEVNKNRDLLPITLSNLEDLFVWMGANNQPSEERSRREVIGNAYLWGLWIDRNDSTFNNKEFNSVRTANSILSLMFLWLRARVGCRSLSSWVGLSGISP